MYYYEYWMYYALVAGDIFGDLSCKIEVASYNTRMIKRISKALIQDRLKQSPAVALVGPRQCGKTTLAQALGGAYFDLEDEGDRIRLDLRWDMLLEGKELVVLDEAQTWPEVFPRLRGAIDRQRSRKGRFLLLGSVSPALMRQVSESLAGRLSLVELTPLLLEEVKNGALDRLWLMGGYPEGGLLGEGMYPRWQRDYLALLSQRDLPNWGLPATPAVTDRLMRMVAAVHGQEWNASKVAQSLAVSYKTINSYMDYLVGSFLVRRLEPFHANIKKRLVKRPKVYWRDPGLLHAMMQVRDLDHLLGQPWVGASWEGFVVEQILGHLSAWGATADAYHLRTSDQYEIDLLLEIEGTRWAIETKLTSSPSVDDLRIAQKTAAFVKADQVAVVSRTAETIDSAGILSTNLPGLLKRLHKMVC